MKSKEELEARKRLLPMSSLAIMAYIMDRCKTLGVSGLNSVTKIQKLTFICYGCVLAGWHYRLCDESPEAGEYGPVFRRTLKLIHSKGLDTFAYYLLPLAGSVEAQLQTDVRAMIDACLRKFGKFSGNQLANWLTTNGSPWEPDMGQIPDSVISVFFASNVLAQRRNPG